MRKWAIAALAVVLFALVVAFCVGEFLRLNQEAFAAQVEREINDPAFTGILSDSPLHADCYMFMNDLVWYGTATLGDEAALSAGERALWPLCKPFEFEVECDSWEAEMRQVPVRCFVKR